jgi:hypothetical protein
LENGILKPENSYEKLTDETGILRKAFFKHAPGMLPEDL